MKRGHQRGHQQTMRKTKKSGVRGAGESGISASCSGEPGGKLSDEWEQWIAQLEQVFVALFTVCALYAQREIATALATVRSAVHHMSQIRLDNATIRLLAELYGEVMVTPLQLKPCSDSFSPVPIGGSPLAQQGLADSLCTMLQTIDEGSGVGDEAELRIDFAEGVKKRKRPAAAMSGDARSSSSDGRKACSFSAAPRSMGNLPALIAIHRVAVSGRLRQFACSSQGAPPQADGDGRVPEPADSVTVVDVEAFIAEGQGANTQDQRSAHGGVAAWAEHEPLSARNLCSFLACQPGYQGQLAHASTTLPRTAALVPLEEVVQQPSVRRALLASGISSLFAHQAQALRALWAARHVMLSTPTSSGKSLVYSLPAASLVSRN